MTQPVDPRIPFYGNKLEEVLISKIVNDSCAVYVVTLPIYSDPLFTIKIGSMIIKKNLFNLDALGNVQDSTSAIYNYEATWDKSTGVKGSSTFVFNLGNQVLGDGSTEVPGTYYGALDGVGSSGNFRNYGGSAQKIKDDTNIRKYLLDYFTSTNLNTLPSV